MIKVRAIITGAGTGIGRAAAIELSRLGCQLVLVGRRLNLLQETAEECAANGSLVLPHSADISTEEGRESVLEAAKGLPEGVEPVLINSAGLAIFGPLHEMPSSNIERLIRINLTAPIELARTVLPWMLESGGGRIVNVSSMAATHALPGCAVYAATKAGLVQFGRAVLAEYRRQGILVTTVIPGATDTPLWDEQGFCPDRADMIPAEAVGKLVAQVVTADRNMVVEEVTVMPVKGIL